MKRLSMVRNDDNTWDVVTVRSFSDSPDEIWEVHGENLSYAEANELYLFLDQGL